MNLPSAPLGAYEALRSTKDDKRVRDVALLALRIGLSWIFIYHGAHTLFSAFPPGGGVHNQAVYFTDVAHLTPGTFFAVLGGFLTRYFGSMCVLLPMRLFTSTSSLARQAMGGTRLGSMPRGAYSKVMCGVVD